MESMEVQLVLISNIHLHADDAILSAVQADFTEIHPIKT